MSPPSLFPSKLSPGDEVRIISPARSLRIISSDVRQLAIKRLEAFGLKVTFSKNCEQLDNFLSSPISSRLEDLHEAFADPNVKGILTTIGGYNSIQLLKHIDYKLIKKNPKVLCGYSDITTLQWAIYARTGLVTFSGPHFSTFGCLKGVEYVLDSFHKQLFLDLPTEAFPSDEWSDDEWYLDAHQRTFIPNAGWKIIQPGSASGPMLGGNLNSLLLLKGSSYFPSLRNALLFLEDNAPATIEIFDRQLSAILLDEEIQIKGLIIGRFQKKSNVSMDDLIAVIQSKKELESVPVIAGVDFGHTLPMMTLPIGGYASLHATDRIQWTITKHPPLSKK